MSDIYFFCFSSVVFLPKERHDLIYLALQDAEPALRYFLEFWQLGVVEYLRDILRKVGYALFYAPFPDPKSREQSDQADRQHRTNNPHSNPSKHPAIYVVQRFSPSCILCP